MNHAPFVHYPKVNKMLSSVEALFKDIESLPSTSSETGARVPVSNGMNHVFLIDSVLMFV